MDDYINVILETIKNDVEGAIENESPIPEVHVRDLNVPDIKSGHGEPPKSLSASQS